jgi:hypothetical protein
LIEERELNAPEIWIRIEPLNHLLFVQVLSPESCPLALLLWAGNMKFPMDVFASLPAQSAGHALHDLIPPIRLPAVKAYPSAITHNEMKDSAIG